MRDLADLAEFAVRGQQSDDGGAFLVRSEVDGGWLQIIASTGLGWDHVSVSRRTRTPRWEEMEQIKRLFFKPEETAMQLHVGVTNHVNTHPHCLHIWRPNDGREIPLPLLEMV